MMHSLFDTLFVGSADWFSGFLCTLAYRPFLDPLDVHGWWLLFLFPLLIGISMVYKAVRLPSMEHYWKQVSRMTAQIFVVMVLLVVGLYVVVQWVVPLI